MVTTVSEPDAASTVAAGATVRIAEAGPADRGWEGWESFTVAWGGSFWIGDGVTWMRAVSFFGAALMVTGVASAYVEAFGAIAGGGAVGLGARGGMPGLAADGGIPGAEGGRGGGVSGRVAGEAGGTGVNVPESGVGAPIVVVSFFGATPGALMRTVSRLTIGVSSGLGGRVMRTVSFFGAEGSAAGLFAEGSSSAI